MAPDPTSELVVTPKDAASCCKSSPTPPKAFSDSTDEMRAVARKFADQPIQETEPGVWAVLTAISEKACLRPQGINILLSGEEHYLGRGVEDRFQISDPQISTRHCRIYKDTVLGELNRHAPVPVLIKDTSSNGTYVNWKRLKKSSSPIKLNHGDVISFISTHKDSSYSFVYREVNAISCVENGATILKRKSEEGDSGSKRLKGLGIGSPDGPVSLDDVRRLEKSNAVSGLLQYNSSFLEFLFALEEEGDSGSKRLKGLGIGSPDGPVSLDDVRRLEKSNADLREQLEAHVVTIETLRTEIKVAQAQHGKELEELRETTSTSYLDQTKSLRLALEEKQKQLDSLSTSNTELHNSIKDLDERLSASKQSRADADEIILSQKTIICELEGQLSEERNLRREERDKAAQDMKSALHKVQAEAQEEIKRQTESYLRQQREQKEVISKLQEAKKEIRLLVETLRSKLEDARDNLVTSEKKVRELEARLQDEQLVSANNQKKSDNLETELRKLKKELENEKAAREEAWAKVSALELEIAATIRDLSIEKQRYQGDDQHYHLRQYGSHEDEENYENTLMSVDLNKVPLATDYARMKPVGCSKNTVEAPSVSTQNTQVSEHSSSDEDANMTEQHAGGTAEGGSTQGLECSSPERSEDRLRSGFHGNPVPTAPEREYIYSNVGCDDQRCDNMGETMPLEDEAWPQENEEAKDGNQPHANEDPVPIPKDDIGHHSEDKLEYDCSESKREDAHAGAIGTADLLTSEVAGSWAVETAPSVNGENESPRSVEDAGDAVGQDEEDGGSMAADALLTLVNSEGQAAGSQNNAEHAVSKITDQRRVLSSMIEIVDLEFKKQMSRSGGGNDEPMSDAETDEGSEEVDADDDSEEPMVEDSVG